MATLLPVGGPHLIGNCQNSSLADLPTKGGRQFLIDYGKLVDYLAVSGWVQFTEGFTSAPRLHDKIEGGNLKRGVYRTVARSAASAAVSEMFLLRCTGHEFAGGRSRLAMDVRS